jgi:hypothetical protein
MQYVAVLHVLAGYLLKDAAGQASTIKTASSARKMQ